VASSSSVARDYDVQLRRAETLSSAHPESKEILAFYSKILSFQKSLAAELASPLQRASLHERDSHQFASLRHSLDLTLLLPHFRPFLSLVGQRAPTALATAAHELSTLPTDDWISLLSSYWQSGSLPDGSPGGGGFQPPRDATPDVRALAPEESVSDSKGSSDRYDLSIANPLAHFFPRAFLQPYAALLASQSAIPPLASTPNLCPLCGALPVLGILRPEGDGAKRSLLCAFCSTEWNFRRLLCPSCGETGETKLPVFIAEQFPYIRTEACETCRTYLRTIDLSKDGHAIPTVDDLAALPLSLWAHEHHYSRLHPNLLST